MKKVLLIVTALVVSVTYVSAQWDTAGLRLKYLKPAPALAGTGLVAVGSMASINPVVNSLAVALRDKVVRANLPKLHFDDYIQYLPAAAPWVMSLCGVRPRHSYGRLFMLEGGSYLLGAGWVNAVKYGWALSRPDGSNYNSFPSGHTFVAFAGAELLRREFGDEYPWIAVAGYMVATAVALMRVYNNRHWVGDVMAGAGIGLLSVTLVYWALD